MATDAVSILTMEDIPGVGNSSLAHDAWRRALLERLQLLVQADQPLETTTGIEWPTIPENGGTADRLSLTVFLIPGESPDVFLHKAIGRPASAVKNQAPAARPQNTVAALIEI